MKATEILENVKSLLGVELSEDKKIVLASEKLANGTEIQADSFETGSAVFIETEDESVPLPTGDYELESGQILVVIEEGVIAEIKDEVEASEVVETEMAAQPIIANPEKEVEAFQFNYQKNVRLDRQQRIKNILNNLK